MPVVPLPRVDARRLPGDAAARAGRLLRRGLQGGGLRLPEDRAPAVPGGGRTTSRPCSSCSPCLSILYGSVMAFTQTNLRLILGYSSMAQLGFITLGLFAADSAAAGAQGALMQAINHGLVVAPMFLVLALLAERVGGLGGPPRHGRDRVPRARAGGAVPRRDAGHPGHARLGELRRRVPDPARRLRVEDGVLLHRRARRRAGLGATRCGCTSGLDAQPPGRGGRRRSR